MPEQHFERREDFIHSQHPVGDVFLFLDVGRADEIGVRVKRSESECEDPFSHFVDFDGQISVQFFEFKMQFEEFLTFDVPMITTHIHVEDVIVGQQVIEFFGQRFRLRGVESDMGFHGIGRSSKGEVGRWLVNGFSSYFLLNPSYVSKCNAHPFPQIPQIDQMIDIE